MSVRLPDILPLTCLCNLPEPLHQHHGLDQLHVAELRVPVNVGGADQDVLPHLLLTGRQTILPTRLLGLEQRRQGDVVLRHHSVQHVLVTVGVLYGQLVKLY